MKTMNVSLPDSMRDYIEQQVKADGYGSVSEYIRDLIRQDQKRQAKDHLEALLMEGLDFGTATPSLYTPIDRVCRGGKRSHNS